MPSRSHLRRGLTLTTAVAAIAATTPPAAAASPVAVSVSAAPAGVTPRFVGFNNGHYRSTSNTSAWVDYAGVNAFRVWAAASEYENPDDRAPYGDGVTTLEQFDQRKAALRADLIADPDSTAYVNWPAYNWSKTQSGRNKINLNYALGQFQQRGIDVVLQTTRSNASIYPIADWGGKWEQWQWYYAIAHWAARNYDVQRYQMYNEPDHSSSSISRGEWLLRLQLASDAVRSAITDVNARFGKSLTADVYAPVAAGTTSTIETYGKDALLANRTDFAGRPIAADNLTTYDVHRYNSLGSSFAADQVLFDAKVPQYNASGQNLPVTYSEFNRHTAANYSSGTASPDNPVTYSEFGTILPGAMTQDVKGMYAFKFNQTYWTSSSTGAVEPMESGFYYVDDSATAKSTDAHHTTGVTQNGEVWRLSAKAFKGERPRFAPTVSSSDALYDAAGSFDPETRRYYYYADSRSADARTTTLDLSVWDVAPGTLVSVEEVSSAHHGSVSRTLAVPASRVLTFAQPAQSVVLLTIPSGQALASLDLTATADAHVRLASPLLPAGSSPAAYASRSATSTDDEAAYLKFSLGATANAAVSRALLRLTGQNVGDPAALPTLHVYGILNDAWNEATLTWATAPNLSSTDAEMTDVGTNAFPVGQLTYDAAAGAFAVDVTDFVRRHPDASLSFVVLREERFAGDADAGRVQINTREAASGKPQLALSLYPNPVHLWSKNADASFNAAANWDAGAPAGPGTVAVLGSFITSPHTLTLDAPVTLGELRLNNASAYTLTGASTLTLSGAGGGPAAVSVHKGSHTLDAPVTLATPTIVTTDAGTMLTITRPLAASAALTKSGPGTLRLIQGASVTPSLSITDGTIDLADGTLLLTAGSPHENATSIRQYLRDGRLTSSAPDPNNLLSLGYLDSPSSVLVRLTYTGDANMDGTVDADDYTLIDRGLARGPAAALWRDGDFDYDGAVTNTDYLLIDRTFVLQGGAPLSPDFLTTREAQFGSDYVAALVAAVPEPTPMGACLSASLLRLSARQRRLPRRRN